MSRVDEGIGEGEGASRKGGLATISGAFPQPRGQKLPALRACAPNSLRYKPGGKADTRVIDSTRSCRKSRYRTRQLAITPLFPTTLSPTFLRRPIRHRFPQPSPGFIPYPPSPGRPGTRRRYGSLQSSPRPLGQRGSSQSRNCNPPLSPRSHSPPFPRHLIPAGAGTRARLSSIAGGRDATTNFGDAARPSFTRGGKTLHPTSEADSTIRRPQLTSSRAPGRSSETCWGDVTDRTADGTPSAYSTG